MKRKQHLDPIDPDVPRRPAFWFSLERSERPFSEGSTWSRRRAERGIHEAPDEASASKKRTKK